MYEHFERENIFPFLEYLKFWLVEIFNWFSIFSKKCFELNKRKKRKKRKKEKLR